MKCRPLFLTFFVLAGLCFAATGWAEKKNAKQIEALLKDEKKELSLLKKKIAKQNKLISSAGKKEGQLLSNLKKVNNQIKLKERELKVYKWNFLINKKKLAKIEGNLKNNEKKIKAQKRLLGKRFRQLYKEGLIFPLKVVFSSENASQFFQHLKYMELIIQHDASLMTDYKYQLEGIKTERQSLLSVRAKLVRLEKDAFGKRGEFKKAQQDKKYF